ncbi:MULTISPECIES: GntR family transcriptional regulator [unclassified Agarivorans]|uniref:GntR family transcriptional regulator n=1 Tax=unclassified Agarivorans TaxID=2636026 RepID=UPI003D7CF8FE
MIPYEKIHNQIVSAIVAQKLEPGARLPEDKLADSFKVSRTAIRKVLQQLAVEHLVSLEPNKGAQVKRPSIAEAQEIFDSRGLIEPQLLPMVMANFNRLHQQNLSAIIIKEGQAKQKGDFAQLVLQTAYFHIELSRITHNRSLSQFVQQLVYRSSLIIAVYGSKHSVGCNCGNHSELLRLLEQQDSAQAMAWMTQHLEMIRQSLCLEPRPQQSIDFDRLFSPEV